MNKKIIFIYFWIFYIFWIFINNIFENLITSLLVLLFLVVLFLLLFLKTKKYIVLYIICFFWYLLWIIISNTNIEKINKNKLFLKNFNNKIKFEVQIENISKINDSNIVYIVRVKKINKIVLNANIFAEIYINWNHKIDNWEIIKFESKISYFEKFNWFNYEKFNLSKNIYFKTFVYNYETIWKNEINIMYKKIYKLREKLIQTINNMYTKNEATFLSWILLWARENLPKELKENFNNSWLTHLIAVSWFNITIIIIFFSYIIKFLPASLKILIMTLLILLFTILVWAWASVIRASIMGVIWFLVISYWRKWDTIIILLFTLCVMITYSPLSLNYDISLQLSFLAVLWIIYFQKTIENIFYFLPNIFEIKTAFSLTLSALILTLPVMLFNFWQVSIIAPISNILVIWTIPLSMFLWFLSIIFYQINSLIWISIWYITWVFLKWDILIVNYLWSSSFSNIKYDFWIYKYYYEIIYFIIIIFIILWFKKDSTD